MEGRKRTIGASYVNLTFVHFLVVSSTIEGASLLLPSCFMTQWGGVSHLLLQVGETRAYVVLLLSLCGCVCVCERGRETTSAHACVFEVVFHH